MRACHAILHACAPMTLRGRRRDGRTRSFTQIIHWSTQNSALNYVHVPATDVPYMQTSIVHRNRNTVPETQPQGAWIRAGRDGRCEHDRERCGRATSDSTTTLREREKQHTAQRNAMRTESQTMECMSIVTGYGDARRGEERRVGKRGH